MIPVNTILQPANVAQPYADLALITDLQLLTPQYYDKFVERYGDERWATWLATYGGMEKVENDTFFWFESRGKLMTAVNIAAAVNSPQPGATVTITLASGDHYDAGEMSPLRDGETLRVASSNIEGKIVPGSINKTTPGAFTFQVRPERADQAFVSLGSTDLLANEILIFGGITEAGEASDSNDPLVPLDIKRENFITEIRDTWKASDKAGMAQVFYNSGVTGSAPGGLSQAGTSYFTYKGLVKTNERLLNNIESKLLRGDVLTNTGITNSKGTKGLITQVDGIGPTITYTPGSLDIAKMHEITRQMDVQGCAKSALWLQDLFQRSDFSDSLFSAFPAGAWVWGSNERSEEAAIKYGAQSISIDGRHLKVKRHSSFNTEVTTGKSPQVDFFRNYGIIMPEGQTVDARDANKVYKSVQIMYQEPVGGGTTANGIRVWQHGGGSRKPTSGKMVEYVEMITYRGVRVAGANQFIQVTEA